MLAVPPGTQPRSTRPNASAGSSRSTFAIRKAPSGIMVYCPRMPTSTSRGRFNKSLKSSGFKVMPMPNMITPSRMLVRDIVPTFTLVKGRNTPGRSSPTPAKRMVSHAMYLPARSLNLFRNFIRFFLFSLLFPLIKEPSPPCTAETKGFADSKIPPQRSFFETGLISRGTTQIASLRHSRLQQVLSLLRSFTEDATRPFQKRFPAFGSEEIGPAGSFTPACTIRRLSVVKVSRPSSSSLL